MPEYQPTTSYATAKSPDPRDLTAADLAKALGNPKRAGSGWKVCCPAHDDRTPSLTINDGESGHPVFHCHAGCTQDSVMDALRAKGLWGTNGHPTHIPAPRKAIVAPAWVPMLPPPASAPRPEQRLLACDMLHEYCGADDRTLFYVKRIEAKGDTAKLFFPLTWGTLDGVPGWHQRAPIEPRPLYGLNRLSHAPADALVLVCEGEASADAAGRMFPDHVALSWMGGAKAVDKADWSPLIGRAVIVWPDADTPGSAAADQIKAKLPGALVLDTAALPKGFDAADLERQGADGPEWLAARLAPIELKDTAQESTPAPAKPARKKMPLPLTEFDLTEDGVALAFTKIHGDKLRYCHDAGKWYEWTGVYWRPERTRMAFEWVRETSRLQSLGAEFSNKKQAAKASFARGVEQFAQSDRAHAVTSETWDTDPFLLGTPGGTIDLKTAELLPPRQLDFITKQTAVAPATTPDCPLWLNFLRDATAGDAGLIRFLSQWCGYTLTGNTREHALLFIYGPGGNGKSVFLNTVFWLLGSYARMADMGSFTSGAGDRHPTDLAMLAGARMVCASETEEGHAWAETRIKQLTGGDPITARFMRMDFFTYTPAFKLAVIGNHLPVLRNVDEAARRRFNVVPFVHKPAKPDSELEAKLRAEGPAILRWMIEGGLDWQKNGLARPAIVTEATGSYFSEQDNVRQWVIECCETGDQGRLDRRISDTTEALFRSWTAYALASGEKPGTVRWFSQGLARQGYEPTAETPGHRKKRGFLGISVKHADVSDQWQNRDD